MPRLTSFYICQQCGYKASQFLGRCPECGNWNSLVETIEEDPRLKAKDQKIRKNQANIINLADIKKEQYPRLSTKIGEFDRVLGGPASLASRRSGSDGGQGGGIVLGSVVLISGDPGIGKSTLLTQLALNMQGIDNSVERIVEDKDNNKKITIPYTLNAHSCLYVAGEESAQQIKLRVERIKPGSSLKVLNETDVDVIIGVIREIKGDIGLVIIDSIQTMETSDLSGIAGSVGQVRESAHRLQALAKELHIPIFLVGHITKEGTIAGPKTLEHLVDVVLSLEGDPASNFRILRASKNRFGPADEVGIFEMEEGGMVEVSNPSKVFLAQKVDAPGSAVCATMNGYRPILVEIQALVTKTFLPYPKRQGSGIDNNRLQLLVAVLTKRLGLPLFDKDIFINVTGGLKVYEPAADLAICLAIISSLQDKIIPQKTAFIGEVGLLGELRFVRQVDKRVKEAKKLGFTEVISSASCQSLNLAAKKVIG